MVTKHEGRGEASIIMIAGDDSDQNARRRLKSIIILLFIGFIFVSLQASDRFDLLLLQDVSEGAVDQQQSSYHDNDAVVDDYYYSEKGGGQYTNFNNNSSSSSSSNVTKKIMEEEEEEEEFEGAGSGGGHLGGCEWYPQPVGRRKSASSVDNSDKVAECLKTISRRILDSSSYKKKEERDPKEATTTLPPLRWLFFGDSTMRHMWYSKTINKLLLGGIKEIQQKACPGPSSSSSEEETTTITCYFKQHERCNLNEAFNFPPISTLDQTRGDGGSSNFYYWKPPNLIIGEGPQSTGLNKPNCQDCNGCRSNYAICHRNNKTYTANASSCVLNSPPSPFNSTTTNTAAPSPPKYLMYGGYFSIEFARDVEIQTPTYGTTQENVVADFIHQHYNSDPWFLREFGGLPICVVSAGIHDIMIQNITLPKYLINVDWYLRLLLKQCQHIIWLQNAAPKRIDDNDPLQWQWKQTQERVYQWNQAVVHLINSTTTTTTTTLLSSQTKTNHPPLPSERITILDVFNASLSYHHTDNIHLDQKWYDDLGLFFVQLAQKIASSSTL